MIFTDISSKHCNLCNSSSGEKPWSYVPVRDGAEFLHRGFIGSECDEHHFSEYCRLGSEHRISDIGRKVVTHDGDFLGDNLTGTVDVCAPVEFDPDN